MKKLLKKILCAACLFAAVSTSVFAQYIQTKKDENGWRLLYNNRPIEVKGIVWSYTPIGETTTFDLFSHSDEYIMQMIDTDMTMLKSMGVNTIRCFSTIPPKWVEYIYTKYGIYTMINDLLGRYGVTVNGKWFANTDYSDEYTRKALIDQAKKTAETYRGVKGVLMYMFGNESNYGLVWSGSNIENLPTGEQDSVKAGYLYSLLEEAMAACKDIDPLRPVGFINGDTQNLEIIKQLCPSLDILGINAYRGYQFYDSFYDNIAEVLDKPIVLTETGADAFNAVTQQEDQYAQAVYIKSQWKEIYEHSYGKGKQGNILGGYVFEWVDEWWKHYQNKDLTVHNTVGTWGNAGYDMDYRAGLDNMNEEWFGIAAQSTLTDNGISRRIPRAAYYLLSALWKTSLYDSTVEEVEQTFASNDVATFLTRGESRSIKESLKESQKAKVNYVDTTAETFVGLDQTAIKANLESGKTITSQINPKARVESTVSFSVEPVENLNATVVAKAWTTSPFTKFDDEWGLYNTDYGVGGNTTNKQKRFTVYQGSLAYTGNSLFDLNGYYHVGHAGFEGYGDIFTISKEAFDIVGYDTYGSMAPIALELKGKDMLNGLTIIGGPEIWGGAKPQIQANYYRVFPAKSIYFPSITVGAVYAEEFGSAESPAANPYNSRGAGRKASVEIKGDLYPWATLDIGLLHAGSEKIGAKYYTSDSTTAKQITFANTLGASAELGTNMFRYTYLYGKYIYRGLVADTTAAAVRGSFFTGDSGSGNRQEIQVGAKVNYGYFSFNPVFRARVPLAGANNRSLTSEYPSPFIVFANRQAIELEGVLTFDPEGATWFHEWNSDDIEGAKIAASLTGLWTIYAGPTDYMTYLSADGVTWYSFDYGLPEQRNLWQVGTRIVTNPIANLRVVFTAEVGHLGSTGGGVTEKSADQIIDYWQLGVKARWLNGLLTVSYENNKWGEQEWYRTFNITFPSQWTVDLAYGFTKPSLLESTNRVGIKWVGKSFDSNSSDGYGIWNTGTKVDGKVYSEVTLYANVRF